MKKIIKNTIYGLMLFSTIAVWSQDQFIADTEASKINWKGFKPTGEHFGIVKVKSGSFTVENKMITAGDFEIDMNSIVVLDIPSDESSNAKLTKHLKNDDFFGVKKHPVAIFKLTSTEAKTEKFLVKGDLTIKGITHPVSFLAEVSTDGESVLLKSEKFEIDRSKWNIKYKSQSFFSDLGDKFISDDMELSVEVHAVK
ncbi:MAG: YceI family protein [Flavobacteriales bacterium]|nr:YceI family protein [Flavobacteriales bacterium]